LRAEGKGGLKVPKILRINKETITDHKKERVKRRENYTKEPEEGGAE